MSLTAPNRLSYVVCMFSMTQLMTMAMCTLGGALSTFGV